MNKMIACLVRLLLASSIVTSGVAVADNWVFKNSDRFGYPEGGFRSQGVTTDGEHWYFSWQQGMERTGRAYQVATRNFSVSPFKSAIPQLISGTGGNHIGDIDYHVDADSRKTIYAAIEDNPYYRSPFIAIYDAETLAYTGVAYKLASSDLTRGVPWVAIDPARGLAYTAEWTGATKINAYRLTDFARVAYIPLSTMLYRLQGGKVLGEYLYVSSDNAQKSIYRISLVDGSVTEVLQIGRHHDLNDGYSHELEGLSVRHASSGDQLDVLLLHGNLSRPWSAYTSFLHFQNAGP